MARIRCPKCSNTFTADGDVVACPSCRFSGRIAGRPAATRPARVPAAGAAGAALRDKPWIALAVFAVVLILVVTFISLRFTDESDPLQVQANGQALDRFPTDTEGDFTDDQDPQQVGVLRNETGERPDDGRLRFSGVGQGERGPFEVNGGILRIEAGYDGSEGYFSVKVRPVNASQSVAETFAAPESGPFSGSHYVILDAGQYVLDVSTSAIDATWRVTIAYPDADGAKDGGAFSGSGYTAMVPVVLPQGDQELQAQYFGDGRFDVEMFDWRGQRLDEESCGAHGFGAYDKVKTCFIADAGPYFVNVEASGDWRITF